MYLGSSGKSSQCLAGLKVAFTGNHNRLCDDDNMDTELIYYVHVGARGNGAIYLERKFTGFISFTRCQGTPLVEMCVGDVCACAYKSLPFLPGGCCGVRKHAFSHGCR